MLYFRLISFSAYWINLYSPVTYSDFEARWKLAGGAERANYGLFLQDLCDLIGVPRPDPTIDEYLRLAYQGQRTKDKAFQCALVTDFDPTLSNVEVAPSEIGRVLLNLFNNAFYAIQQQKQTTQLDYVPTVSISTKKTGNKIFIRVKDNGNGIPEAILAKVFQPFFTTKPTGQGTGLGLSLSYDIVTKGHRGTLEVESEEGEGSMFTITLPYQLR